MTVCCHFVGRVPSPTTFRHVSGNKKRTARNTVPDAMVRNQKVADQFHRISSKPLIRGATLAGVLRLDYSLTEIFHIRIEAEYRSQDGHETNVFTSFCGSSDVSENPIRK